MSGHRSGRAEVLDLHGADGDVPWNVGAFAELHQVDFPDFAGLQVAQSDGRGMNV